MSSTLQAYLSVGLLILLLKTIQYFFVQHTCNELQYQTDHRSQRYGKSPCVSVTVKSLRFGCYIFWDPNVRWYLRGGCSYRNSSHSPVCAVYWICSNFLLEIRTYIQTAEHRLGVLRCSMHLFLLIFGKHMFNFMWLVRCSHKH